MAALVERLAWDSDFFGRPIGRARIERLDEATADRLLDEARAAGLECVYFAAAADDLATLLVAEARGFHLVDVRVVFERSTATPLPSCAEDERYVLEPARADELPRLERIAEQVSRVSRYAFDPRFPTGDVERLYRTWIRNALGGSADAVLVAREAPGAEALGFACCKLHGELCDLELVGVDEPYRQRRGGRALVAEVVRWAQAHGAKRVQVVTQAHNVAAQRLYQRLGFLTAEVKLRFHLWLTPPTQSSPPTPAR
ncbi:MAG TPA: GNAT family N-acetyltransferase [Candidatus Binatia bacterium]